MFRPVPLPATVTGSLWLHSMPGRYEPLEQVWEEIRDKRITTLVCLAETDEVRAKSPSYAQAIGDKRVPCEMELFPIQDYGAPGNREEFWLFASRIAQQLREGRRVLMHCAAGIGRTGTVATCILLALEQTLNEAQEVVLEAGSHPETREQRDLVSWCEDRSHS